MGCGGATAQIPNWRLGERDTEICVVPHRRSIGAHDFDRLGGRRGGISRGGRDDAAGRDRGSGSAACLPRRHGRGERESEREEMDQNE